jgi:hypothetical protein
MIKTDIQIHLVLSLFKTPYMELVPMDQPTGFSLWETISTVFYILLFLVSGCLARVIQNNIAFLEELQKLE